MESTHRSNFPAKKFRLLTPSPPRPPQSDLQGAFELLNEAANIFQNVHGALSKEVAQCCKLLAVVLFHAEDYAGAIAQGHKELILNERILGLDHPDTIHR